MDDLDGLLAPLLLSLDGEELLALWTANSHPERPIIPDIRFNLMSLADANAKKQFRFDVRGVLELARLFKLPEFVITSQRDKAHKTEAVCILLSRLSYPNRNYDMMLRFGRSTSALSRLFSHMVTYLYTRYQELIYFHKRICAERINLYCDAVHACGAPMKNVYGFIDGTKIPVCRPSSRPGIKENLQKQIYSGHKRVHCMNFQAAVVPDGLAIHCWGPMEGRRHDITMLRESKLADYVAEHNDVFNGYALYGDPAYGLQPFLVSGFKGARVSEKEKKFNKLMSSVREAVEWEFAHLKTHFVFVDYKKSLKIRLSPVGKYVLVSMLLLNCHCCHFGGNQISTYFGLDPPSLDEYLTR